MDAYLETTVWSDGSTCNHTYLLDGDSMIAYIPKGKTTAQYFTKPIRIDRRGRKFERLATSPFEVKVVPVVATTTITVQGSKGQTYTVDTEAKTCTCAGFTFRGTCKHVKELE